MPARRKLNQRTLDKMTAAKMGASGITSWHDTRISVVGRTDIINKLREHYYVAHLTPNYVGNLSKVRKQKKKKPK